MLTLRPNLTKNDNNAMFLSYGIRNFLSFKDGATVSFELDGNVPVHVSNGKDFATILCVKGANGSGKTHLLKGLAFLANFVNSSFSYERDASIPIAPFARNREPSAFFAEFRIGDALYLYELEASPEKVHRESLYRTLKRKTLLFERRDDSIVSAVRGLEQLRNIKLPRNASVISMAHQHELSMLEPVHQAFSHVLFNVSKTGVLSRPFLDIDRASEIFEKNPPLLAFATKFLRECDVGISDIKIGNAEEADGKTRYFPIFIHTVDGEDVPIHPATESSGTKQLYCHLLAYALTLSRGGTLVLDEFDLYLHPLILPKLLDLFLDETINPKGAQLLFTTHQSAIMDMCGRYRTYLVSKEDNASFAYRLDEVPGDVLRNDRSISQPYIEGRIGGVPKL